MSSVDEEVVDEQRLAWRGRGLGQLLVAREHIDEARLADVGTPDEGVFRAVVLRALVYESATLEVGGRFDIHSDVKLQILVSFSPLCIKDKGSDPGALRSRSSNRERAIP